jgi:hypothetical protein
LSVVKIEIDIAVTKYYDGANQTNEKRHYTYGAMPLHSGSYDRILKTFQNNVHDYRSFFTDPVQYRRIQTSEGKKVSVK